MVVGALVTMDGSGSTDANGDPLTFKWTLLGKPTGSTATLTNPTYPNPKFTADLPGNYIVSLVVNDGKVDSAQMATTITASATNAAPVANAGVNQNVVLGTTVTLDGTASTEANNDPLTSRWVLLSKPTGSSAALSSATSAKSTLTADLAGSYVATLVVNDGKVDSAIITTAITASAANATPVANAGVNQNVLVSSVVTLDASASTDANGDALTYSWILISKPTNSTASLSSSTVQKPTFSADLVGTYVASLAVNDGKVNSVVVATTITASAANATPVANAGVNQNVLVSSVVTLDASASSDANGDALTYNWILISKPTNSTASLSSSTAQKPTFSADLVGTYVASLIVNDGKINSVVVATTITAAAPNVAPVANAGSSQTVVAGALVTLTGAASTDANGDSLSYKWTLTTKPTGSTATLSSSTGVSPTLRVDIVGTYVASLIVNDGKVDSAVATVPITATTTGVSGVSGS